MTKKQYQNRQMAQPRPSPAERLLAREQRALLELQRIGWRVQKYDAQRLQLERAG